MTDALDSQLTLLEEFSKKAFSEHQEAYAAEVANKLRLLLARFGSNKPLLFDVATAIGMELTVVLDGPPIKRPSGDETPPPGTVMSLEKFFDLDAFTIPTKDGSFRTLTKIEFIRTLAEQHGGAHEDWTHDEAARNAARIPFFFNGAQIMMIELHSCAELAWRKGREVVAKARETIKESSA